MKDNIITIHTGPFKIAKPLHHYNETNIIDDVIIIVDSFYDNLYYINVDSVKNTLIKKISLTCTHKIKKEVTSIYPDIKLAHLNIETIMGIYDTSVSSYKKTCIFVVLVHNITKKNYIVQLDMLNHDKESLKIKGIQKYYNTDNTYFDTLITTNVLINDTKSIRDTDVYITYMNKNTQNNSSNYNIEGIRVLYTDEEKEEYVQLHDLTLSTSIYPIIDEWSVSNRSFFVVTEDVEKVQLNFSTGVGFINFKE